MESMLYVNGEFLSDSEDVIDEGPEDVNLTPCPICTRTFAQSALEKHVGICEKMHILKRTPFDSFRQRRGGTDLETYLPSNYGLIAKPKTLRLSPTETKSVSRSISSVYSDTSSKFSQRRLTPTRSDATRIPSRETPLMNRSMNKRSLGPINEICPHCSRSFGTRAYDRHVDWCKEKSKIHQPTLSAQQHLAKERMQARTKYKAPSLRSKRDINREKYSSLSESMNNLSDGGGGVSIMDFNSVADPYERGRKSSIMSLSMTSSIASDCGFSEKYDPFISAKRQMEDLFNTSGIATSTPVKDQQNNTPTSNTTGGKMTKSLITKSPSSPTKNQPSLSKSNNFRRSSSLRVKKTSPISYMPKYKPTIQRGISDEGPISSNFMKPEEFDELPVKSHAVIPPDLVPKSPNPVVRREQSSTPSTPVSVIKRQNSANRRNLLCPDIRNAADFPLTKTDSLAAFLKFENDLECLTSSRDEKLSEKELKDKSNNLNKKSLSELNDNKMMNETNEFSEDRLLPAIDTRLQNNNPIILAPIEKPLIKHKIVLEPIVANSECNNNNNNNNNISSNNKNNSNHNHNNHIRIDDNDNSIDSNLINSCDNLKISNLSKLPNESSSFDPSNHVNDNDDEDDDVDDEVEEEDEVTDASIENCLIDSNKSMPRDTPIGDSKNAHQKNMELIVNLKNINDMDKRNPKRQLQLQKDNLLFDSAMKTSSPVEDSHRQIDEKFGDELNENKKNNHSLDAGPPVSQKINDCNTVNNSNNNHSNNRKLTVKDVQDIETLFDDFDLEEFISSFSDNEQFPIFKNYKEMISSGRHGSGVRKQHGSESTSEESEFDDKFDASDIDVNERERTVSATSSIEREKSDNFNLMETNNGKATPFEKLPLNRPDLTIKNDKQMQIEADLNKFDHKKHATDTKLSQLQEILDGEIDDGMSPAERELLASVQELNSMCDNSYALNSHSTDDNNIASKDSYPPGEIEASFKSLFLSSPATNNSSNSGLTSHFKQRIPTYQSTLSYQVPEIVGLTSPSTRNNSKLNVSRSKAVAAAAQLDHLALKNTDSAKLNTNGTKSNTSTLNGFDRVLPPIVVHKNDSQNIYNTINMTSSFHDAAQNAANRATDSVLNSTIDRKLSSSLSIKCKDPATKFNSAKLSRFCHECGAKFIVDQAKFCMDCGVKRALLD